MTVMKKTKKHHFQTLWLVGLLCSIGYMSCTPMDHYYKELVKIGDRIYAGKIDSVWLYSGYSRVKIAWERPTDPSVSRVVVYWNANRDSAIHEMDHLADTGAIIIEGLPEGL